jgi:hypothetical protein
VALDDEAGNRQHRLLFQWSEHDTLLAGRGLFAIRIRRIAQHCFVLKSKSIGFNFSALEALLK